MFFGLCCPFFFLECIDAWLQFLVFPTVTSHTTDQHWQGVRYVEVHAQPERCAHSGSPFNEHAKQEPESKENKVTLAFCEDDGEGGESVGLRCDEVNSAFSQLNGQENRYTCTDDGSGDNTHDVALGDVVGPVPDVQAVLVISNHRSRHRNRRAEHRGANQTQQHSVLRVQAEQVLEVEENTEQHQQHDEGGSRNGFNTGFAHHSNGDGAQHERREDENGSENKGCNGGETADGENQNHGEEGDDHEDGDVFQGPLVPTLAFHVFLATFTREGGTNVRKDVGEGSPHLGQTKHTATDDGPNGNRSNRLGERKHLQRRRASAGVFLDRYVGLLNGVVNGKVGVNSQRHKEEPTHDGSHVDQKRYSSFHEPSNGKHGGREGHADVGVGEGVPRRAFRPLCVAEGDTVFGARWLVNFSVGVEGRQTNVTPVNRLCDEIQEGHLAIVHPNQWVFNEEQPNHGQSRPHPDGLEGISSVFYSASADI